MKLLTTFNCCTLLAAALLQMGCSQTEAKLPEKETDDFSQVIPTLQGITADWNMGDPNAFATV